MRVERISVMDLAPAFLEARMGYDLPSLGKCESEEGQWRLTRSEPRGLRARSVHV